MIILNDFSKINPIDLIKLKTSTYTFHIIDNNIFIEDNFYTCGAINAVYSWKNAIKRSEEVTLFNLKWVIPTSKELKRMINTLPKMMFFGHYWTSDEYDDKRRSYSILGIG